MQPFRQSPGSVNMHVARESPKIFKPKRLFEKCFFRTLLCFFSFKKRSLNSFKYSFMALIFEPYTFIFRMSDSSAFFSALEKAL